MHGSLDDIRGAVAARRARGRGAHASDAGGGTGLAGPAAKAGVANPGAQIGVDRSVASPGDVPMPIDKRGNNALTAGPDPRVQFPADSRDHAAIFGTQDEDELALAGQERAVDEQRMRLQALERLFNQTPGPRAAPAGTIPLSRSSADQPPPSMPKLAPRRPARAWTARWMRDVRSMPCSARWMACCATPIP